MKRKGLLIGALAFALSASFAAVFSSSAASQDDGKLHIVTTIFPEYDWIREVMGETFEDADVTFLLDNGVDLHSFQPTVQDMVAISGCDLFVYVGGESDAWVRDALSEGGNEDRVVIDLMEVLADQVKEEEVVEGMQEEACEAEETGEAEEGALDHADADDLELDEHIWLSVRNAMAVVQIFGQTLREVDPDHAQAYEENAAAYCEKLQALDDRYIQTVEEGSKDTLLFADRFPFRYLTDDYGLDYYAAFSGCSAETEASFETVIFLAGKADELGLNALLTIKGDDQNIAQTVRSASSSKNQEILVLDSMQNTTPEDVEKGVTYLSIMEENLEIIRQALM